ncbi:MAG: glycosyl transferase [Candidatus Eisenbacteria bacterium RBG_16_71_46]|nr:MAG: glycosyl transferase [Candidatus Eisenbacteria bacterium RBG_16_71_46]
MSDYFQNGVVTTLHRLGCQELAEMEARLVEHAESNRVALVIPCLVSELQGPALGGIVAQLAQVSYLEEIVIALGRADRRQFEDARRFFAPLGSRCRLLWIEGPRMQEFIRLLAENDLEIGPPGKGRASWLAIGYVLAGERCRVIALHDADILTYDRSLLGRLCYPLVDSSLGYEYAKGYYCRVTDRLHGRVTRLFVTPLVRAMIQLVGAVPFLRYIDSFRYPLAGEFAMHDGLARSVRIPGDWGLEMGMLAEVYRNTSLRRVCQVDVADNYDHKHQPLSPSDASTGLNRMARDICKSLLRTLAMEGVVFGSGFYTTLKVTYLRTAQDAVRSYHDDAVINGLKFDRHSETQAVEMFTRALAHASEEFEQDPLAFPGLPNWNRITAAIPDVLERYRAAVDADSR